VTVYALINQLGKKNIKLWEENGALKFKAPKGTLSDEIRQQLITNKDDIVAFLQQITVANKIPPIAPIDRTELAQYPLSFSQERIWFINQLEPDSASYNIPSAITMNGELNIDFLDKAFNLIIARHENLRTIFPDKEGQAQQVILDSIDFKLERVDLSHYKSDQKRHEKAKEYCNNEAETFFDLSTGPLIRGSIIKLAPEEHIFMFNMHHIISDGWSMGVLFWEIGLIMDALERGHCTELPPLSIQYLDYSVWQRKWLEEGGILKRQLDYWREKLTGVVECLDFGTDYPRPSEQSFAGANQTSTIGIRLTERLKSIAEQQSSTLYMVLLAAYKVLIYRYTDQEDICLGGVIANRQYEETESLIGVFINSLALRSIVDGRDNFLTFLDKVKCTCLDSYEHQDAPFEKVVEFVQPQRNIAVNPLFQIMVILQNAPLELDGHQMYPLDTETSNLDQIVGFTETPNGLNLSIDYSTVLYNSKTIEKMVEHFSALCEAIAASPTTKIDELDYIGEAEKQRLLIDFNQTQADYSKDKCIHQLFAEQVKRNPNKTAVVYEYGAYEDSQLGSQRLSYQQLYDKSNELALYLQSQGVKPDSLVGLCVERSLDMMVGILGIVQAGGAYVPFDSDYPDERLSYMLQDSQAAIVLTQEKFQSKLSDLIGTDIQLICLDKQWSEISDSVAALKAKNTKLREEVKSDNLVYVIYTSGSTGQPKGVMLEHRALTNRINWMQKQYSLDDQDVVLQKTPYSFDVSAWEFFWPMMSGASIVFAKPEGHKDVHYLEDMINKKKVTTLHFVPSMLNIFLENAKTNCESVRQVFCSGEALGRKTVDNYKMKFSNALLHNLYGPTEAAIDVTAYKCSRSEDSTVPIGSPIDNIQIYILDQNNSPKPIGVAGELHIAGDGLARGYLNLAELSDEKFIDNPFSPGSRMYKSGDLARWLDDGNIEYLGRIDTQVKIRGFRIEMGEIETQLNQHPQIKDCALVAQGQEANKQLIAFYVAKGTTAGNIINLNNEDLKTHLRLTLPEYMLPITYVSLEIIPLTHSGKVNRRVLERKDVSLESSQGYLAPRNDVEKQLVDIWAELLNLKRENVGVNDNFFELGGHSLLAVQIIAKMEVVLTQKLPVSIIITAPTIAAIAKVDEQKAASFDIVVPMQAKGSKLPIFAIPGADGGVLPYLPLSQSLGNEQPFYGLQAVGLDGKTPPLDSVEKTAEANIYALKKIQNTGPYSFVGFSYGGLVAYEMARLLLEQGEDVRSLVILDTLLPSAKPSQSGSDAADNENSDEITMLFEVCKTVASLSGAIFNLDIKQLQNIAEKERSQYIVDLLKEYDLDITIEQFETFYSVFKANDRGYRVYKPQGLSQTIDVSLYRATENNIAEWDQNERDLPDDYGWNQLLLDPINTYEVEANHFSILNKEHSQYIAKQISLSTNKK